MSRPRLVALVILGLFILGIVVAPTLSGLIHG